MISFFGTSNKPFLWKKLYENLSDTKMEFEIVFTGPKVPEDWTLPSNFKYLKTNVKPSQGQHAAYLYCQGEYILCTGDDTIASSHFLDTLFPLFLDEIQKEGHDKIVLAPQFRDRGKITHQPFIRSGRCKGPNLSLINGIMKRSFMDEIGGFDKNFMTPYAQIDTAMMMWEKGGKLLKTDKTEISETTYGKVRICGALKGQYERPLLTKLWHRPAKEGEIVPSEDSWGWHNLTDVISKKRLYPMERFEKEGILEHSQGMNIPDFGWD